MSSVIEQVDTRTAAENQLSALHDLYLERDSELFPNDPETPWPQRLVDWRYLRSDQLRPQWVYSEGGRMVAVAGCYLHRTQDLDNGYGWIYVRPGHRRRGIARAVVKPMFDYLQADNRKRFAVDIPVGHPSESLARRAGLKDALREVVSQLRVAGVDRALLDDWIERARERASDYEVISFTSPIPDEYRERYVAVMDVMNTAPLDDFEEDPFHWTEEMVAEAEAMEELKKRVILTCIAIHKPSGVMAGFTDLVYQSLHPAVAHQWNTGVDPGHRNLGLGRWLKATMLKGLIENYPEVEIIETQNAASNESMLNINIELGFKPATTQIIWQGDLKVVRDAFSV